MNRSQRVRAKQLDTQRWLQQLAKDTGSIISGRSDCKLCWHHIDPGTKRFNVGRPSNRAISTVKEEIAKCHVLTTSEHTKLHRILRTECNEKELTGLTEQWINYLKTYYPEVFHETNVQANRQGIEQDSQTEGLYDGGVAGSLCPSI